MSFLFHELIYRPLYNVLIFIYNALPFDDFGIAIIVVTLLLKLVLIPLSKKQIESQKKMQALQPKIKEIQEKYKKDKEKQSRALMELYKTSKTNPFAGCVPIIVQLVFLIAIYRVLFNISTAGLVVNPGDLYSFVRNPGQINQFFMGIISLSSAVDVKHIALANVPQVLLIFAAAFSQYIQMKMMMDKMPAGAGAKESDFAQIMSKQMLYLGPVLTLVIGFQFPSGVALYWLVSTVFMIVQQYYLQKNAPPAKTRASQVLND